MKVPMKDLNSLMFEMISALYSAQFGTAELIKLVNMYGVETKEDIDNG